jgi:hypothetical protein
MSAAVMRSSSTCAGPPLGQRFALLVTLALLFLASKASAAQPPSLRTRVALLDLTQSTSSNSFNANVQAIETLITNIPDGVKVLVVEITDSFGHPQILLDEVIHAHGTTNLDRRAAREVVLVKWRRIVERPASRTL